MFGLLLIVAQFVHIFAESECIFGDSDCWINYANSVIVPKLADGIPELGIEGLDTLHIKDVDINNGATVLKLTNVTLSGFKNTVIEEVRTYADLKILRIILHANLTMESDYHIKKTFLTTPLSGSGKITFLLKNVHVEMLMSYDIIKDKNGKSIRSLKNFRKSFHSNGGIDFDFKNNDKRSKDFEKKINGFLNENWRVFEGYGAEIWTEFIKQIFNAVKILVATYEIKTKH